MDKLLSYERQQVSQEDKENLLRQKGCLVWVTGYSGSGKSTVSQGLSRKLYEKGKVCHVLDGDNMRRGLCSDLGFSDDHRVENIRRIREVGKLFVESGIIVVASFISPFNADRCAARDLLGDRFLEVHVDCPLDVCESRDVKGLYAKARRGEIKNFTGIDSPYERPLNPDIRLKTDVECIDESIGRLYQLLVDKGFVD